MMYGNNGITITDLEILKIKMNQLDSLSKQFIAGMVEGIRYERAKNKDKEIEEGYETT
ncbi:hypothetical protein [Clostridium perfringens]|uniref:hypothetical protein n=1 Tax=Clostridium perfringens TaxID=1502 RepID=UPI0022478E34|nr:hypothetical protein [Clostridium perfringens]